jgi:alginate production protein
MSARPFLSWCGALAIACAASLPAQAADSAATGAQEAQFQLPPAQPGAPGQPAPGLPRRLPYAYRIGSESDVTYTRNRDLDRRLKDNTLIIRPEFNAYLTYRPTDWLETQFGIIADVEFLAQGNRSVTQPSGDVLLRETSRESVRVDEAFFTIHNVIDPFSLTLGRRKFEDARHWLYDTSMDVGTIGFREGRFRAELSAGREVSVDLDAFQREPKDSVETYMFYGEYRAFEGVTFGGYFVHRDDHKNLDGTYSLIGARSIGRPIEPLSYWAELAIVRGEDQAQRSLRGFGFDVGATWRFMDLPLAPNVTLGYAFGSGDERTNDNVNNQFRQTGLQSNEARFAGLSDFKYYGEALDPELSNIRIITAGLGFRPIGDMSVDFVYHYFRQDAIADTLRNYGITGEPNQDPTRQSKDLGHEVDIILGFRNVFGVRRLGFDVRAGRFFPGKAFRNALPPDDTYTKANTATVVIVKLWW